ncbi:hypothetical protein J4207_01565 [Candidatus Woesearchaeota archaeon]|nr:hypothetical protein [Candidatus Woesearchaeota archaeon]
MSQSEDTQVQFDCVCGEHFSSSEQLTYKSCPKCKKLMIKMGKSACKNCKNTEFIVQLDIERILEIDTLLISSRHLYRAPYSLHEKSGLASLPIHPSEILTFDKKRAQPDDVQVIVPFIPRNAKEGEASSLFLQAFDYTLPQKEEKTFDDIEIPTTAIPEQFFPECIKKISQGMADGKKRAVFILINFLRSVGWSPEQVEQYLTEWNKKNSEPLRENYLSGQLRYTKTKKPMLPPNCANTAYYQSLGCKCADNICSRFKNPVNTTKANVRRANTPTKTKKKKTEAPSKTE